MPGLELVGMRLVNRRLEFRFNQGCAIRQVIITAVAQAGDTEGAIERTTCVVATGAVPISIFRFTPRLDALNDITTIMRLAGIPGREIFLFGILESQLPDQRMYYLFLVENSH